VTQFAVAPTFRVCVTTAAVVAVCDRRSLFFNSFGAHRAPLQLKMAVFTQALQAGILKAVPG